MSTVSSADTPLRTNECARHSGRSPARGSSGRTTRNDAYAIPASNRMGPDHFRAVDDRDHARGSAPEAGRSGARDRDRFWLHAALVAHIVGPRNVVSIERHSELAAWGQSNLRRAGFAEVTVVIGDGSLGHLPSRALRLYPGDRWRATNSRSLARPAHSARTNRRAGRIVSARSGPGHRFAPDRRDLGRSGEYTVRVRAARRGAGVAGLGHAVGTGWPHASSGKLLYSGSSGAASCSFKMRSMSRSFSSQ